MALRDPSAHHCMTKGAYPLCCFPPKKGDGPISAENLRDRVRHDEQRRRDTDQRLLEGWR